jgi:N-acetylneuraminic acid mutarotase
MTRTRLSVLLVILFVAFAAATATLLGFVSGTWQSTGSMSAERGGAASVLLPDGSVLVTGGNDANGPTASAESYSGSGFSAAAAMHSARAGHTATLLPDGRVLVTGGNNGSGATNSAEVYDPSSGSWSTLSSFMVDPRSGHSATLLDDGTVLLIGGGVSSVELFDPSSDSFSFVGSLNAARTGHGAALMKNGSVLVAGGADADGNAIASVEIFDPVSGSSSPAASLSTPRNHATATTDVDGWVVVIGGNDGSNDLGSGELYDAADNSWTVRNGGTRRSGHLAVLLPHNNNILVVGGTSAGNPLASVELYETWTDTFKATGPMSAARSGATLSDLSGDGQLLVAGGSGNASAEVYYFPTIKTDKDDYAPGTPVYMTGGGWQPGEQVALQLHEVQASGNVIDHSITPITADSFGNITYSEYAPTPESIGAHYHLTAVAQTSGLEAQTIFTDGNLNSFVVTPPVRTVLPGTHAIYTITAGFGGDSNSCTVSLTAPLPVGSGLSGAPNPLQIAGSSSDTPKTSTLDINTTGATPGTYSITVTGARGANCEGSGNLTGTVTLNVAGPAHHFTVTGFPDPVTAGTTGTFTVTARDANGNTALGYTGTVHFTSSDPQAVLPANYIFILADAGAKSFGSTILKTAGSQSITATDIGNAAITGSKTVNVTAAAPNKLAFLQQPMNAQAKDTITPAVTVQILDTFNNLTNSNNNITLTLNPAAGVLSGGGSTNASGGIATFNNLQVTNPGTGYTLIASDGAAVTNITSNSFNITQRGTTTTLTSSAAPSNQTNLGDLITFTATVVNGLTGNDTASGTVTFFDGVNPIGAPVAIAGNSGVATLTITTLAGGVHAISAQYNGDTWNSTSTSNTINHTVTADSTPPVITPVINGTLGNNGWYTSDVTVSFTVTGAQSTITSRSAACASDATTTTINTDTAGTVVTCTAASAGGTNTVNVTIKRDATAPNVSATRNPAANANGWNNTDVTVSYSCSDTTSGVNAAASDLANDVLTATGTASGTCVDNAGNSATANYSAQIDKTAPSITATPNPAANANGWNNTDVTVSYVCIDGDSGVEPAASSLTDDLLTASGTATGTCVDKAGNSASANYTAQIDKVKPVIAGSRAPLANAFGWNNVGVDVTFSCTDSGGSGIDINTVAGANVATEGANQEVTNTGTCTDKAGNVADSAKVTGINIDKTAPTITAQRDTSANANGWNKTDVASHYNASDGLSGLVGPATGNFTFTAEGAGQAHTFTVNDMAGNSASATVNGVNIDKTAPTLSPSVSPNPVVLNGSATATPGATDGLSGIDSASCPAVPTNVPGSPQSVSCTATDKAGNTNSANATYRVVFATGPCLGSPGKTILQPINFSNDSVFKQGSTVPAKFRVCDANGVSIGTGVIASFSIIASAPGPNSSVVELANPDKVVSTNNLGFRFDPTDQQWIYNINTKGMTGNYTYKFRIHLTSGEDIDFVIGLKQ